MFIEIKGLKINYTVTGSGKDVLFLHGWGCPSENYKVLTGFVSSSYRVTTLDFPGFGSSQMPEEIWGIEDYAEFVAEFISSIGLVDPILIGHSHGGRVALYMCAKNIVAPEKIILLGAAGVKLKPKFRKKIRVCTFKMVKHILSVPLWKNAAAPLLDKARRHFGSADYNSAPPVLRQTLVKLVNFDITPFLKSIKASTLLIYGENDTATPLACAEVLEKNIPDAGLCVIKNADHFAFAQKPHEVNAIIGSFLGISR